ncbi:phosphonatase-like hydrolase [Prauserella alba]|uniref:Phosphonatase-like hydrolase n=1 Tax=Prauserella alba TaxID=176898 RepID=A0ABN1VHK0_9PSEU|nr:phosphonatase-like hydrolase [Prauserella alba]MCP2183026.1 phosphonatase-like hydrolase [Prauserella alba]
MSQGIELVVLDMAGTTVHDGGLVEQAFDGALEDAGMRTGTSEHQRARRYVWETMGQSKIEVFDALFPGEPDRARRANAVFECCYDDLVAHGCEPISGAEKAMSSLRDDGVRVCLTTGFARGTRDRLLERLGWRDLADLVVGPEEAGRGRPYPDMIHTAARNFGVVDPRRVAVAGDTGYDVLAGTRSGASVIAGVLTGAHDARTLTEHGATHVLESVADLPAIVRA